MIVSKRLSDTVVIRVVTDFLPSTGGSITHTAELSEKIGLFLGDQFILVPRESRASDSGTEPAYSVKVIGIEVSEKLGRLRRWGLPALPAILASYSLSAVRTTRNLIHHSRRRGLVHAHGILLGAILNVILRLDGCRTPIVITQDSANQLNLGGRERLAATISLAILALLKPGHLIVVDDGMGLNRYARLLDKLGIRWSSVYHAVTLPESPDKRPLDRPFTVIVISRLTHFKRVDLAIRGYAQFRLEHPDAESRFLIVGDGPERERLRRLVEDLALSRTVAFIGDIRHTEVWKYLRDADVLVASSMDSNLNISVLEAMAAGLSVVAYDNGEMEKLITHMEDGVLVSSGSTASISGALSMLHDDHDLMRRIGEAAREKARIERSWNRRVEIELSIYDSLLRTPRR